MVTIAIDGPAAAGKGTVAKSLSDYFKLPHLDTGSLYRAAASRAASLSLSPEEAARTIEASDFTRRDLRTIGVGEYASVISAIPAVRSALNDYQVAFAEQEAGAILDGRDIGTTIAPHAEVKFFMTASPEVRARRRHAELMKTGDAQDYQAVLQSILVRDQRDTQRLDSPLAPAPDAILLDTTDLSADQVVELAIRHVENKLEELREFKWHNRFLELADTVASWSKDPSTKVGAVIVDRDRVVIGMGYNGFPRGVSDTPERLNDRAIKYLMVKHAEENAIANATRSVRGATCYVTHAPCAPCTGTLIQHGISRVITRPTPAGLAERLADSYSAAEMMRKEAQIDFIVISR